METRSLILIILSILAGAFSLLGAIFDWDFFFNSYKARRMVNLIGRTAARIFYAIVGIFLIGLGICVALSIIQY